jgi:hypothetical protein
LEPTAGDERKGIPGVNNGGAGTHWVRLAGDHPASACSEVPASSSLSGDLCFVLTAVEGIDEVAGADEERVEGDVLVGQ